MPSFEIGPTRAVGATTNRVAPDAREHAPRQASTPDVKVASSPVSAGQPPVDVERVAHVRKAIEDGTYPIVPTKIADAMIAAGILLRVAK